MRDLWELRGYLRPYWKAAVVAVVIMAAAGVLMPEAISRTQAVFDGILKEAPGGADQPDAVTEVPDVLRSALILFAFTLAATLVDGIALYLGEYLGQNMLLALRAALFTHLQRLAMSFYDRQRVGDLISRVNNDSQVLQRTFGPELAWVVVCPVAVAYGITKMSLISWRLTLILFVLIPIVVLITAVLGQRIRVMSRMMQERMGNLTTVLYEALTGVRIIKIFGIEPQMAQRFADESMGVLRTEMRSALARAINAPIVGFSFGLALVSILYMGSLEVHAGRLTGGGLVTFVFLVQIVINQVSRMSRVHLMLARAAAAARRHLDLLAEEEWLPVRPDAVAMPEVKGRISLEHVSFAYQGRSAAVCDVSIDIAPGEVVALAGPSGAGKTTIANLVPRLYDPTSGRVLIDGVDVRDVRLEDLRRHMSIVPQETLLFCTTVRENIAYGRVGATEEEIVAAAKTANAHDFIMQLPEGYDTQVGDRGTQLSGGQRQRIAIARAVLRDPAILILDEATSSLDSESETAIHKALDMALQGRTAIIIAHRLSTIRDADRIVVMDRGHIVETGRHEELVARGGLYAKLHWLQQDGPTEETSLPAHQGDAQE